MGRIIDLDAWRSRRRAPPERAGAVARLELAVVRVDQLVARLSRGSRKIEPKIETELLAITGAVSMGLVEEAANRAERLADLLAHPAMRARS